MDTSERTDDRLRITSVQRERAVELLRQAAADGRLEFDEMNARVAVGLEARTQGELRGIVGDLVPHAELAAFLRDVTPPLQGPGATWDDPLLLGADRKAVRLNGVWEVPPFIELHASMWHMVRLDFQHAVALAPVIDLVLVTHNSSPTFIFPQGWGLDTERVSVGGQAMFNSNVTTRPARGMPRIVMRGHLAGGSARYATARDQRRAARALARPRPPALPGPTG